MGSLIKQGNSKIQGETVVTPKYRPDIAHATYLACVIYAVFVIGCLLRYACVRNKVVVDEDEDEE